MTLTIPPRSDAANGTPHSKTAHIATRELLGETGAECLGMALGTEWKDTILTLQRQLM